jgi:DNA-binding MarR family transcriptional regulator
MSTKLTELGTPMVESLSLKLAFASRQLHDALLRRVASRLIELGYEGATPAALEFLGALECGDNHASEIARMMGVSRQWVAKNVAQFCRLGYLEQLDGPGRGKRIVFTERGEALMSTGRAQLAELDRLLSLTCGEPRLVKLLATLESASRALEGERTD